MQHWWELLVTQFKEIRLLEWIGVAFGVAEVLLAKANKVLLYPAGIVSITISTVIFVGSGLYAEALLQLYYFVMSVYGWLHWAKRKHLKEYLPISVASAKEWRITIAIVAAGFGVLFFLLTKFTDSTVPVFDAWISATAWAGMWLLAKRKIENWILLNISNAFAIPLLFYKQLPLYACLTIFLFIIAILGYRNWKQKLSNEKVHPSTT